MSLMKSSLNLAALKISAQQFSTELTSTSISSLYGVTDGKAVGSYVEKAFVEYVSKRFDFQAGNSAQGLDFPKLSVDIKVTSIRQPQSSCPFISADQKVYGLGYHLLVFVYEKTDIASDKVAKLEIKHVIFIDKLYTGDFQTTKGICELLDSGANADDLDAFIEERNLPLDYIGRRNLATRLMADRPRIGWLTISNALQWRLQYTRAIEKASSEELEGVENLSG
ncbi:restriction endonuclease [Candidatus Poriferisocius sp.]|uniref:restriction endonuclease n=1 Tax=Candidatus Poriferisocius sp. TaxID=3101276 RepID=UPI003B027ECF